MEQATYSLSDKTLANDLASVVLEQGAVAAYLCWDEAGRARRLDWVVRQPKEATYRCFYVLAGQKEVEVPLLTEGGFQLWLKARREGFSGTGVYFGSFAVMPVYKGKIKRAWQGISGEIGRMITKANRMIMAGVPRLEDSPSPVAPQPQRPASLVERYPEWF